jgi:hypothetical protein
MTVHAGVGPPFHLGHAVFVALQRHGVDELCLDSLLATGSAPTGD